jgi:hypothetical protein
MMEHPCPLYIQRLSLLTEPLSWREDLSAELVRTVEEITAPLLEEFYPD